MSQLEVRVPDIGTDQAVEIVEVCVADGDSVEVDESLVVLETDKATFEVPSTHSGRIESIKVKVGDKVSEGDLLAYLEATLSPAESREDAEPSLESEPSEVSESSAVSKPSVPEPASSEQKPAKAETTPLEQDISLPNTGTDGSVTVVEVAIQPGQSVHADDTIVVVESDKATMEIPSPFDGEITQVNIKEGDQVSEGDLLAIINAISVASAEAPDASAHLSEPSTDASQPPAHAPQKATDQKASAPASQNESRGASDARVHAGPAVRKLARELSVDLSRVNASGPKGRILKDDLHAYIKQQVEIAQSGATAGVGGGIPQAKLPDFSAYGEVEVKPMTKIHRVTAVNMQTSWLNIPHVTQFEEADITEMEAFRKAQKTMAEQKGMKLTPMPFLLKACAYALNELPQFNVSIDLDGAQVYQKKYIHIGIAVDTPAGLVVPVIKNVDKKGIWQLAEETIELAAKARDRKLTPSDMQGGCFTISSLGGIGGTAFTPIVNLPEVAILGVSKAQTKPVYNGQDFEPKLMLPLSLSYDHRAINGADAARFTSLLSSLLGDLRQLIL